MENISALLTSSGFMEDSLLFWLNQLNTQDVEQWFTLFLICSLMLIQYMDSHASNLVLSFSILLLCGCSSTYCSISTGMMSLLPLITSPSITARSSLNVQFVWTSCGITCLLSGHPFKMYSVSCWWCMSFMLLLGYLK